MEYAVGIDLHGTLMENEEIIMEGFKMPLKRALERVKGCCRLYLATGNDLEFVKRKIDADILSLFDGLVLETGCVISDGIVEEVLVDNDVCERIREFQVELEGLDWVHKFDRRLTSIAAFTKYGQSPEQHSVEVAEKVREYGLDDVCYVTYSSVAVDVVPNGFNKFTGLKHVADGLKTVGVADSMNDLPLHIYSDYGFAPSNISPVLREKIINSGRDVTGLGDELTVGKTYVASKPATEGVIEVLDFISLKG